MDENLINCNFMNEPQQLYVGSNRIYISDNTKIHIISKLPGHQLIKSIKFNDSLKFFALSGDEKSLFFGIQNEKNKVYLKNLTLDNDDDDNQVNRVNNSVDESSLIIDLEKDNEAYNKAVENFTGIVDIGIISNHKFIALLTTTSLFLYDYNGKFITEMVLQNLNSSLTDFKPMCLAVDENKNTIFIGNKINDKIGLASQINFHLRLDNHPIRRCKR